MGSIVQYLPKRASVWSKVGVTYTNPFGVIVNLIFIIV